MEPGQTRRDVLRAAADLFAAEGYGGASTRAICARAGASANAVHYHFGSKLELYREVLRGFTGEQLASARRLLDATPDSAQELRQRLVLFAEETLVQLLEEPARLQVVYREMEAGLPHAGPSVLAVLTSLSEALARFVRRAARKGLLRKGVDAEVVAGLLIDRLANQARFAPAFQKIFKKSAASPEFRRTWCRQNIDIVLEGVLREDRRS